MASIYKEILLDLPAAKVWEAVRDIGHVHERLVPGYAAQTRIDGDMRILSMSNGNIVKELILGIDDERFRLAYAVVETSMPIIFHHASFQVFPESEETCRLVWITDVLPQTLEPDVRIRVDRGAAVMKRTLENMD